MLKKNFWERLFSTVFLPPAIFAALYYGTAFNCLLPCFMVFLCSLTGSYEIDRMIFRKNEKKLIPFWLPSILVPAEYIGILTERKSATEIAIITILALVFFLEVKAGEKDEPMFSNSTGRISRTILLVVYPNYLLTFWIRILNINSLGNLIFFFMIVLVFVNDSSCYCVGMLFGKGTRGIVKVSPKKSLAGYIGGFVLTPLVGYAYTLMFPSIGQFFKGPLIVTILSVIIAICADIGDLVESVLKRNADMKDAGHIIPGRGGISDSIDSIIPSAVAFYLFISETLPQLSEL